MNDHEYFIGDPAAQMDDWIYQNTPDNCAVAAETSIINQFVDDPLSNEDANYISLSNGWWEPGSGTSPDDIGNMMDLFDVPNHTVYDASVAQLLGELQQGHGVIVGVNSSELWDQSLLGEIKQFVMDALGLDTQDLNPADHALVVTGVDMSDPSHPQVILNDSGMPGGDGVRYPLDQFVDAWQNGGYNYTATDNPMPSPGHSSPGDLGFDLGDILGLGTTLLTGDFVSGELVNFSVDTLCELDWEQILS
jgi:hypothetical protein